MKRPKCPSPVCRQESLLVRKVNHEFAIVLLFGAIVVIAIFDALAVTLGKDSRKDNDHFSSL